MNNLPLIDFFTRAVDDAEILPSHVSLFAALVHCWQLAECRVNFNINRRQLMKMAKISSTSTYHKCMGVLIRLGYIDYRPSYHPLLGSEVVLNIK